MVLNESKKPKAEEHRAVVHHDPTCEYLLARNDHKCLKATIYRPVSLFGDDTPLATEWYQIVGIAATTSAELCQYWHNRVLRVPSREERIQPG